MAPAIRVKGLTQLQRALQKTDRDVRLGWRGLLREAAEPVRSRAEQLAVQSITNLHSGDRWSQMRVGVTTRVVYIAPRARSSKGYGPKKRPAFGPMLMDDAMEPALEQMKPEVYALMEMALDRLLEKDFG